MLPLPRVPVGASLLGARQAFGQLAQALIQAAMVGQRRGDLAQPTVDLTDALVQRVGVVAGGAAAASLSLTRRSSSASCSLRRSFDGVLARS